MIILKVSASLVTLVGDPLLEWGNSMFDELLWNVDIQRSYALQLRDFTNFKV